MTESKLLGEDKDEWFFQSMKKYANLYMFELEYPLDAFEIINETSLCVSGVQSYSKKCEILQLCVPPKLLSKNEEGLCKDRDFKILSGGYSDGRIKKIRSMTKYPNLVATIQEGFNGVVVYEVGDDDRATILEKGRFSIDTAPYPSDLALCSLNDKIVVGESGKMEGLLLHLWDTSSNAPQGCTSSTQTYTIWKDFNEFEYGNLSKIKEWDNNSCIFLTSTGTVAVYDFRTGAKLPEIQLHATKSGINEKSDGGPPVIYSFDCIPQHHQVGLLDSCGGYETYDVRRCSGTGVVSVAGNNAVSRTLLPDFSSVAGVYSDWFNIEYEPWTKVRENERSRFIISGLRKEFVPVFQEVETSADETASVDVDKEKDKYSIQPIFTHDGHSKPVSHSIWHPRSNNLIFSASVDAVLHAWQFIPDKERD